MLVEVGDVTMPPASAIDEETYIELHDFAPGESKSTPSALIPKGYEIRLVGIITPGIGPLARVTTPPATGMEYRITLRRDDLRQQMLMKTEWVKITTR